MAEAHDTYKIIYQNLIDAGCDENIIEKCMRFVKNGKAFDMIPILSNTAKTCWIRYTQARSKSTV